VKGEKAPSPPLFFDFFLPLFLFSVGRREICRSSRVGRSSPLLFFCCSSLLLFFSPVYVRRVVGASLFSSLGLPFSSPLLYKRMSNESLPLSPHFPLPLFPPFQMRKRERDVLSPPPLLLDFSPPLSIRTAGEVVGVGHFSFLLLFSSSPPFSSLSSPSVIYGKLLMERGWL